MVRKVTAKSRVSQSEPLPEMIVSEVYGLGHYLFGDESGARVHNHQ